MVGYLSSTGQRNVADEDDKNQELKEELHDQCGPKKNTFSRKTGSSWIRRFCKRIVLMCNKTSCLSNVTVETRNTYLQRTSY